MDITIKTAWDKTYTFYDVQGISLNVDGFVSVSDKKGENVRFINKDGIIDILIKNEPKSAKDLPEEIDYEKTEGKA